MYDVSEGKPPGDFLEVGRVRQRAVAAAAEHRFQKRDVGRDQELLLGDGQPERHHLRFNLPDVGPLELAALAGERRVGRDFPEALLEGLLVLEFQGEERRRVLGLLAGTADDVHLAGQVVDDVLLVVQVGRLVVAGHLVDHLGKVPLADELVVDLLDRAVGLFEIPVELPVSGHVAGDPLGRSKLRLRKLEGVQDGPPRLVEHDHCPRDRVVLLAGQVDRPADPAELVQAQCWQEAENHHALRSR